MKNATVLSLVFVTVVGCVNESNTTQQQAASKQGPPNPTVAQSSEPKSRALAARDALFDKLSTRLIQAMSNGGPAAAIDACSRDAQRIATEVSEEHGLQIGRTSFRLRNPRNTPPEWAGEMVDARTDEPQFIDLADGDFAALLPIKLKVQCMGCHGPKDQIDESVQAMLTELYPDDEATGFNIDELRGWFWVQVPATTETL